MTWDQCRELDARGHEIANHSWSHQNEYEISIEETRREIVRNDSAIQRELGKRPLTYFLPFNAYTPEALAAAMENLVLRDQGAEMPSPWDNQTNATIDISEQFLMENSFGRSDFCNGGDAVAAAIWLVDR